MTTSHSDPLNDATAHRSGDSPGASPSAFPARQLSGLSDARSADLRSLPHRLQLPRGPGQREESREALERSRSRYLELFDSAPVPYFVFDDRHCLLELNRVAARLIGGETIRMKHRPFFPHVAAEDRLKFHKHLEEVLRSRCAAEVDVQVLAADGVLHGLRLFTQSVRGESGDRPISLTAGVLTCSRRAPADVRITNSTWAEHLDQASIATAITSPGRGWVMASQGLCDWLGFSRRELESQSWMLLTHADDQAEEAAAYARMVAGVSSSYSLTKRLIGRGGRMIAVEEKVTCTRGPGSFIEFVLHSLTRVSIISRAPAAPIPPTMQAPLSSVPPATLQPALHPSPGGAHPKPRRLPGLGLKVLLVDDDPAVRFVVASMLESLGFTVDPAGSAADALSMLARQAGAYNLVISDLNMPQITGCALAQQITSEHSLLPILIMSGAGMMDLPWPLCDSRTVRFLPKPFTEDQLEEALAFVGVF